jgi:hypothetical protein
MRYSRKTRHVLGCHLHGRKGLFGQHPEPGFTLGLLHSAGVVLGIASAAERPYGSRARLHFLSTLAAGKHHQKP